MALGALVHGELRVAITARATTFRGSRGKTLGTLRVVRTPLRRLTEAAFRRRVARLAVDATELESVWRAEVGGRPVADVVHLFPHNVFAPAGTPPGRGYEVRSPKGRVLGFTDQRGRLVSPTLLYHDAAGPLRVRAVLGGMRTRLTFEDPDGRPLFDLSRRPFAREGWRALWISPDLDDETREALGACLLVALLWATRT